MHTCSQWRRSEDYTEKSSDEFKWPEEISIHLGPVSRKPAVRVRGRERSKELTPDMTDALETRAKQLILCVRVHLWVHSSPYRHWTRGTPDRWVKKRQDEFIPTELLENRQMTIV